MCVYLYVFLLSPHVCASTHSNRFEHQNQNNLSAMEIRNRINVRKQRHSVRGPCVESGVVVLCFSSLLAIPSSSPGLGLGVGNEVPGARRINNQDPVLYFTSLTVQWLLNAYAKMDALLFPVLLFGPDVDASCIHPSNKNFTD